MLHLEGTFQVSERQACRAVGQPRTTQRRPPRPVAAPEALLRQRLRQVAKERPRWGFRRAGGVLRDEGRKVNRKRVQRIWREEGLRVPPHPPKRRRLGDSTVPAGRLQAELRNHGWALDFLFDTTSDGRPFKAQAMCDEYTRESVGSAVARSITADHVIQVLDRAVADRGAPEFIRGDNGPEVISLATRDWCRFSPTGAAYIDPGSPWQNAFVESLKGKARDALFAREIFDTILEARVLYADWCHDYNLHRPHRSLEPQPPVAYAPTLTSPKLS